MNTGGVMLIVRRALCLLLLLLATPAIAGDDEIDRLAALLDEFLAGASSNDIAAHERFWSDELVYTSSNGTRFGKNDILEGMRAAEPGQTDGPQTIYTAEDVDIRVYGDAAVVAFRLVGTSDDGVHAYFNTGTFVRQNGEWRAVAWQATKIPASATDDQ